MLRRAQIVVMYIMAALDVLGDKCVIAKERVICYGVGIVT